MALSIIESRAINNRISTNLDTLNSGNLPILQSRSINKSIDEDMALLNWDKFDSEQSDRSGLEPDGKDNEVKTAKGTKIVTGFMVIEASKLIVSHDEQGNANPDYPQEMQPRDRARDTSQAQIARIAKNLDPDMLGRTRVAYQGAPIIGKDGVVESGNGRAMAITLAYKLGKADEYRAWLLDIADMYGLNPDKIEHMKRPVLVRVRKTEVDRAQFAIEANQSDMLAMTATEKAKSDAARLTDAIVIKLSIEGDLTAASNRDFIMAFLQSLGDDETAGLLTTSGQPTKQLYDRAQAAVFAKAYNDDRLLELMADAEKPEIANIIKSLNQAAQPFITARNISEHATHATTQKIGDAIDVSLDQQAVDAIVKATEMLKKAKDSGMPIEELIKQSDLFGDVDPVVAQMALFIKDNNRSPARMGAAFVAMAEFVVKELESRQNASLFEDDAPIDMVDVLKAANAQLQKQYGEDVKAIGGTGGFIDLFTETRGQKADREAFLAGKDSPIELTGKELGDFPDTKEGKKALRAVAEKLFEDILDSKENWAPCPPLGGKVMLRPVGVKKVISFSADIRKLKIIPKLKELIKSSHKVGTKPNYDQKNSPNIINYHTLRSEVTLAGDKLAVRFVIGEDDKGMYHYDHSIVPIELIFDSVNKNGFAETNPSILMGGIQEFTYNRSVIPEPSCLLPTKPLDGHQDDINICLSTEIVNDKQVLDSINPSRMVFNLFIEGEDPEIVEDDDSLLDLQQVDPISIANINASSISDAIKQKAIKFLQENPASHEIPVISKKSMSLIMQSVKSALFAEIKALSPLFEHEGYTYLKDGDGWMEIDANDSTLKIGVSQQGRMFFVSTDGDTRTSLFDSTSTIAELSEWGFSLPFDLDVKAFVANVIKPVVDEFLSKQKDNSIIDNQAEEQINETEAVEDLVPEEIEPNLAPTITGNTEIDGYKSKLLGLQQLQDRMKAFNKIVKSTQSDEQKIEAVKAMGFSDGELFGLFDGGRFRSFTYQMTNNNAKIVSAKKRITQLEAQSLAAGKAESGDSETSYDFDGGTIELDYSADRLKVDFDTKPDSDMNSKLKRNGFKWSYTNEVWQRQLTDNAISTANYLFGTNIKTAATMMNEEENKPRPNPIIPAVEPVIEPIAPIQPVKNETAEIDAEIAEPSNNSQAEKISAYSDELDSIKQETNSIELMRRLNDIVARIEADNLMDEMDVKLNQASDAVDELFREAQKNAA